MLGICLLLMASFADADLAQHTRAITSVAYDSVSRLALSTGLDGQITYGPLEAKSSRSRIDTGKSLVCVTFDAQTESIYAVSSAGEVTSYRRRDGSSGSGFRVEESDVTRPFAMSGGLLAVGDQTPSVWDLRGQQLIRRFDGFTGFPSLVCFSLDSNFVFAASGGGETMRWSVDGKSSNDITGAVNGLLPLGAGVTALASSPEGDVLALGLSTGQLICWDVSLGTARLSPDGASGRVSCISASGNREFIGCAGGEVVVWGRDSLRITARFDAGVEHVWSLAVSDDARTVLLGEGGDPKRHLLSSVEIPRKFRLRTVRRP